MVSHLLMAFPVDNTNLYTKKKICLALLNNARPKNKKALAIKGL